MPCSRIACRFTLVVALYTAAVVTLPPPRACAEFPEIYDSEKEPGAAMPAEEVARVLQLPPGFKANVFAAEPDVQNPIALAWDAKGRLWVAENYTYAEAPLKFETKLRDRILILSDTDGDGRMDERKVFADDLSMLTSIEIGLGGVWCLTLPELTFIPDADGDDRPDGPPQTHLTGFRIPPENYHNFANGLRFGPDGWLYGRCGASAPADVGRPGTPEEELIPVRGGMWRYSPFTKVFESLNAGTTNPWGHDWDRHGELFFINTVNGHLWHSIPGAHYTRPHTIDPNPHVYELIDFHADHWHYDTRGDWSKSRDGAANEFGGGHAHIGCMIYQGTNWPEQYRDRLFTLNMHGLRANTERLDRHGSGYLAKHEKDLFVTADKWFRGMELTEGPDGAVYVADWSDTGECHERTGVHRRSGRIYRIVARDTRLVVGQTAAWTERKNRPFVGEFALKSRDEQRAEILKTVEMIKSDEKLNRLLPDRLILDLIWSLARVNAANDIPFSELLGQPYPNEHVRTWAVRLIVDRLPLDTTMSKRPAGDDPGLSKELLELLTTTARKDESAYVRLAIASALQRLRPDQRIGVARELVAHSEDATDHNIPLMVWYGLIPTAENHASELAQLAADCKLPTTRRLIARRLAEDVEKRPAPFNDLLAASIEKQDPALAADVVRGASAALTGWRKAPKPAAWGKFATLLAMTDDKALAGQVRELSVLFGDGRALDVVKALALNNDAPVAERQAALQTLIEARPDYLRGVCERTLGVRFLNPTAARGLALFDDEKAANLLVDSYKKFHHSTRAELLAVLASRPTFAKAFLQAIVEDKIPRTDLTAFLARQIHDYKDAELEKLLKQTWGEFRDSPAEKKAEIAKLKNMLTPSLLASADKSAGRALFAKTCAQCHKLYGDGQQIGPDLTGANRQNMDYLLENMVDPSAVVSADFRMTVFTLDDGRTFNGLVLSETEKTVTFRTATETVTVEKAAIEERSIVPLSLMPENQLQPLSETQLRDLFGYLQSKEQVPLPASAEK
jgi:putative membrane-bound dehydrogenase-like protein